MTSLTLDLLPITFPAVENEVAQFIAYSTLYNVEYSEECLARTLIFEVVDIVGVNELVGT